MQASSPRSAPAGPVPAASAAVPPVAAVALSVASGPPPVSPERADFIARRRREVSANYDAFKKVEPELRARQQSKRWALMKDRRVIGLFDTSRDALKAGELLFKDGMYSAQQVDARVIHQPFIRVVKRHAVRDASDSE